MAINIINCILNIAMFTNIGHYNIFHTILELEKRRGALIKIIIIISPLPSFKQKFRRETLEKNPKINNKKVSILFKGLQA